MKHKCCARKIGTIVPIFEHLFYEKAVKYVSIWGIPSAGKSLAELCTLGCELKVDKSLVMHNLAVNTFGECRSSFFLF